MSLSRSHRATKTASRTKRGGLFYSIGRISFCYLFPFVLILWSIADSKIVLQLSCLS